MTMSTKTFGTLARPTGDAPMVQVRILRPCVAGGRPRAAGEVVALPRHEAAILLGGPAPLGDPAPGDVEEVEAAPPAPAGEAAPPAPAGGRRGRGPRRARD